MKPYICKHHGPQEPYIYDRSQHGMNCNFSLGRYGYCPHKRLQLVVSQ